MKRTKAKPAGSRKSVKTSRPNAAAGGRERFPELTLDAMTPEQRRVAEAIMAGPRKGLRGPFNAWLRSPEVADRYQKLGEYVRFGSSLPPRLNELAILVTARAWTAQFEWWAHRRLALAAGLSEKIIDAIAVGRRPRGMGDDERIIYDFSSELHRDKRVSDKTFAATVETFGENGVVDLIAVNGYYTGVSMTLNVAQVSLPEGETGLARLR